MLCGAFRSRQANKTQDENAVNGALQTNPAWAELSPATPRPCGNCAGLTLPAILLLGKTLPMSQNLLFRPVLLLKSSFCAQIMKCRESWTEPPRVRCNLKAKLVKSPSGKQFNNWHQSWWGQQMEQVRESNTRHKLWGLESVGGEQVRNLLYSSSY